MTWTEENRKDEMWNFYGIVMRELRNRRGAYELISWLERTDFFWAPAGAKHHGSYEGGLLHHSLNVYNRLTEKVQETVLGIGQDSVAAVALFHDVCKADFYKQDGKGGYIVENTFPLGHGEKSLYLITKYMELKPQEALAIRWHMGPWDEAARGGSRDYQKAMQIPLVRMLHEADKEAAEAEKKEEERE